MGIFQNYVPALRRDILAVFLLYCAEGQNRLFFIVGQKRHSFLKILLCPPYGTYIKCVGLIGTAIITGF